MDRMCIRGEATTTGFVNESGVNQSEEQWGYEGNLL